MGREGGAGRKEEEGGEGRGGSEGKEEEEGEGLRVWIEQNVMIIHISLFW